MNNLLTNYAFIELLLVCTVERGRSANHFVYDAAERPPIYLVGVALLQNYLRCHVLCCSAEGVSSIGDLLRKSEISDQRVASLD